MYRPSGQTHPNVAPGGFAMNGKEWKGRKRYLKIVDQQFFFLESVEINQLSKNIFPKPVSSTPH